MSESDIDRVWEIMDDIPICMVTTHAGGRMRSRPMHAIPDRDAGCVFFVTDTRAGKAEELWSTEAQAWWPRGPRDPSVRVLRVIPEQAEYWDTRGNSITVALKLVAARLAGRAPDLGESKKVSVR